MNVAFFPFIPQPDGRIRGQLLCGLAFDLEGRPTQLQAVNTAALQSALGLPQAIDWGALIQALLPLFTKSLTPSAGATERFTQVILPDGGYIAWPESLTERLNADEAKSLINEVHEKVTGKKLAGPILDILIQLLPLIAPVLLPLLLQCCQTTPTTAPPHGGPIAP
jgi:hypothetical protein